MRWAFERVTLIRYWVALREYPSVYVQLCWVCFYMEDLLFVNITRENMTYHLQSRIVLSECTIAIPYTVTIWLWQQCIVTWAWRFTLKLKRTRISTNDCTRDLCTHRRLYQNVIQRFDRIRGGGGGGGGGWGYVLHGERISRVITNSGQQQRAIPSLFSIAL